MEIVIENASSDATSPSAPQSASPSFPQSRQCRAYVASESATARKDFYATLQPARPRSRLISPEPEFETMPTSVRRVDRSGLLEIADPETQQQRLSRQRHLTGAERDSSSLTRRVDRSGLLEAVPELPDGWRSPEKSAEPKSSREAERAESLDAAEPTVSSPYLRRFPRDEPSVERPAPSAGGGANRNSFVLSPSASKFEIEALPARARQSYVDLTGATYTRSSEAPPGGEIEKPDCVGRSSPGSRDRRSPLTISAIPDVIEAHGSRVRKDGPEGERAEAEGCERSATDGHEENSRTFKPPNKILHNDNIQTLRVIILSEQL